MPFAAQAPPRFVPRQRRPGPGSSRPQRGDSGAGAAASPPRGGTPLGCGSAQPGPPHAASAAMSSGASVSALQRLVEQLKLEAGVERIKVSARPAGPRCRPRRRLSGEQEAAARRKWGLSNRARAGASGAREPRVDAGWFQARSPGQRWRPHGCFRRRSLSKGPSRRAPWACPEQAGDTLAAWTPPTGLQEDAA